MVFMCTLSDRKKLKKLRNNHNILSCLSCTDQNHLKFSINAPNYNIVKCYFFYGLIKKKFHSAERV